MSPLLEVALNGTRPTSEHPAIPTTPTEIAKEARATVGVGAEVVHLHAYDDGAETLAAQPCAATLRAVRAACPEIPISMTTSAGIEPDPRHRHDFIAAWTDLPDLVTANMGEEGITELCELLLSRGVGIEAGLLSVRDAEAFVKYGLADRCVRVLVEPLENDSADALATAAAIEEILSKNQISMEQVHHGDGITSWLVNERALARGHGIRTGLEDTIVLPDGTMTADNADLVRAAVELMARHVGFEDP
jgi:uncharacterized protein (DUF849 family)